MGLTEKQIQIPINIDHGPNKCEVFIPDFNITVHGEDYVDTIASATMYASAAYYYNLERNTKLPLTTTFHEADALCTKGSQFTTYLTLFP